MSSATWFLGLFVGSLYSGLALGIYLATGKEGLWPLPKRKKIRNWLLLLAALATLYTFWVDHDLRRKTLFEVSAESDKVSHRDWTFLVEHPGVEHVVMVNPRTKWGQGPRDPFRIRHTLTAPDHRIILDASTSFHRTTKNTYRSQSSHVPENFRFTPTSRGPHHLRITIETGSPPPRLHVRIEDPHQQNGSRPPGF